MTAAGSFPKWNEMAVSVLREGPGDGVELPIAPTMKNIHYQGERYFRMESSRARLANGSYGGSYLWDGWRPAGIKRTDEVEAEAVGL